MDNNTINKANIRYKLCTQDMKTPNGFQLPEIGEWYQAGDITSPAKPCTNTVLHHYEHPLLAVLFNPIHAAIKNPRLFEIEIDEELGTDGLKAWCRKQRLTRELQLPEITTEQKVMFAIHCAMIITEGWLNGSDRTKTAARAAAARATKAAWAAAAEWAAKTEWAAETAEIAAATAARAAAESRKGVNINFVSIIENILEQTNVSI